MFVRFKNSSTGNEENLNADQIVRFYPSAQDATKTVVALNNGESLTVEASCRSVRHAITKASTPFMTNVPSAEAGGNDETE